MNNNKTIYEKTLISARQGCKKVYKIKFPHFTGFPSHLGECSPILTRRFTLKSYIFTFKVKALILKWHRK